MYNITINVRFNVTPYGYDTACVAMEYEWDRFHCCAFVRYRSPKQNPVYVMFEDVEPTNRNLIRLWTKHVSFKPMISFTSIACIFK